MLSQMKVCSPSGHTHDTVMIWAACTLAFFVFHRAGETTVPNNQSFNQSAHLSFADAAVDDSKNPVLLQIRIKQSKTDPFQRGVNLYNIIIGRTDSNFFAVSAMLDYFNMRGMSPGPMFRFADGQALSQQLFVEKVRDDLRKAGINQDKYCGHSFCIRAAPQQQLKVLKIQ